MLSWAAKGEATQGVIEGEDEEDANLTFRLYAYVLLSAKVQTPRQQPRLGLVIGIVETV